MVRTNERAGGHRVDVPVRLNVLLRQAGEPELNAELGGRFQAYLELLMRWNARINLTAIRDAEGILSRHFVESIVCARAIPEEVRTLLDYGSGAGLPGVPVAMCRPEIAVTLAESQAKKVSFLREALRTVRVRAQVYAGRAETLGRYFDCVAMRAVDRMERAVTAGAELVGPGGCLALMSTGAELPRLREAAGADFEWVRVVRLPLSGEGVVALGARVR